MGINFLGLRGNKYEIIAYLESLLEEFEYCKEYSGCDNDCKNINEIKKGIQRLKNVSFDEIENFFVTLYMEDILFTSFLKQERLNSNAVI